MSAISIHFMFSLLEAKVVSAGVGSVQKKNAKGREAKAKFVFLSMYGTRVRAQLDFEKKGERVIRHIHVNLG